jgi:hypothetical protein
MTAPRDYCAIARRYATEMVAAYAAEEAIKDQLRPLLKAIAELRKEEVGTGTNAGMHRTFYPASGIYAAANYNY